MRVWKVINGGVALSDLNLIILDFQYCITVDFPTGLINKGKVYHTSGQIKQHV